MMGFFSRGSYPNTMMDRFYEHPWIGFVVGGICLLIVIAIVVAVIIILTKMSKESHSPNMMHGMHGRTPMVMPKNESALRLLDERYARSEIGDDEYKTKKANLLS